MNIFDDLPALRPPKAAAHRDELEKYLSTERELNVDDGLLWWYERKHVYPRLSRMAMDYLSIPGNLSLYIVNRVTHFYILFAATSVHVERTFSQGRLLLSHVRSRLSVQSTRALLCVGIWSLLGYVKDNDVKAAAVLPAVNGEEEELAEDWDSIDA
jgi:hAT family C-terminal dimerisation region